MLRILDELLWALRRDGIRVAPSQAIDVARAALIVGFDDRARLQEALACVLVSARKGRARFDATFERFFALSEPQPRGLWERLRQQGFTQPEIAALREILEAAASAGGPAIRALVGSHSELDRLLATAEIARTLEPMSNPLQAGFYAHRVLERLGFSQVGTMIARLREILRDALNDERAEALTEALSREIERARADVRDYVGRAFQRRLEPERGEASSHHLSEIPFVALTEAEADEVRRAVRNFAARLNGAARVRERHAQRGCLDPRRTMRASLRTGGIPFSPARRDRRRDKARLVVLCDLSDSVRMTARFMLELVHAIQELFDRTRSFVFVSEIDEVTRLFQRERAPVALSIAYSGSIIDTSATSNYDRALRAFEARWPDAVDGRTTVVVLGDGRTNYRPHGAEVLGRIRARAKQVLWLCPDPRATWGLGDSAIPAYSSRVDRILEVSCAADLERAARQLILRS